jgi:multidrug resistance efflux pump
VKRHIENTRKQLGELGDMAAKTEAAERRILERATARLDQVNAELERSRPGIEAAPDKSQDRYTALIQERGQLNLVVAKARKALGL